MCSVRPSLNLTCNLPRSRFALSRCSPLYFLEQKDRLIKLKLPCSHLLATSRSKKTVDKSHEFVRMPQTMHNESERLIVRTAHGSVQALAPNLIDSCIDQSPRDVGTHTIGESP